MKAAMKVTSSLLCLALLGGCAASGEHPMEKVIGMLKDLSAKAVAEGKEEEHAFGKFSYWCKSSVKTVSKAIEEEKEKIESLESTIAAKTKEIATLEDQIKALEEEIAKIDASIHKLNKDRDEEHEVYQAASKDLEDTIAAVEEAIDVMKDAKSEVALVQLTQLNPKVRRALAYAQMFAPEERRDEVTALLQAPTGDKAKHVKVYKFKGGNVIELLKQLKGKFEQDLLEVEKAETNAVNAFELATKALENKRTAAESSLDKKEDSLAAAKAALAAAEADLKDVKEDLAADSETLAETDKECAIKTSEFEERSETRAKEIEAIAMAVKILAEVGGVRTEAPENPVPPPSPLEFTQLSSEVSLLQVQAADPKKMKAVNFLRAQAKVLHSRALERLAQAVSAHLTDPPKAFKKVIGMIQQMIFRLMDEQKSEDEHKLWCDQELHKTNVSIADKEDKVEELTVKIDEASAKIQELTEDIKDATETIANIDSYIKEATEIRETGKKENKLAIKDAQAAQTAIANAIAVLEDFYKESGMIEKKPYEFLQQAGEEPVELPDKPETWGSSYTGAADPKAQPDGIISVMEEVASDFSKMEAETKAQEETDQKAYDDEMSELAIEKATRKKEVEMKTQESKRLTDKVEALEKTKKHVGDELYQTKIYMKDLVPACVSGDSTYEDRKAARSKEIAALKQAQDILENPEKQVEED